MDIVEMKKDIEEQVDRGEIDEGILIDLETCKNEAEIDLVLEMFA